MKNIIIFAMALFAFSGAARATEEAAVESSPAAAVSEDVIASPADANPYTLTIKDHKFTPDVLVLPANEKIKITVVNDDPTPEEFESHDLKREKIIPGNSKAVIAVGPLKPGVYKFFGEFNQATAQGQITVE